MILVDEPMGGALASASNAQLGSTVDPQLLLGVSYFAAGGRPTAEAESEGPVGGASLDQGRVEVRSSNGLGVEPGEEAVGELDFVVRPNKNDHP